MLQLKTEADLVKFLTSYKSQKQANFVSKTVLKMNKKDVATKTIANPFANEVIYKVSIFTGDINFDYEERVNDARFLEGKEQTFEASNAKWGDYVSKALTKKEDVYYIKISPTKSLTKTIYEKADGTQVKLEELEPYLPVTKKTSAEHQELDKEVVFRAFKLESIIHIKIPDVVEYTQE